MKSYLKLEEIRPKKVMVGQKLAVERDIQKLKRKERINYIFAINNSSLKFYEREN